MNAEIKSILGENISVNSVPVPVAHLRYKGSSKTFVVWTMLGERPVLSGDDEPLFSVASVDIDVYSNGNYLALITEIKRIMKENGWLWVEDSPEMYEDDTGLYHKTITFEKERSL
jgi:hypothetical protein